MSNIKWPLHAIESAEIPEDTKDYLMHVGLPAFCDNPWMEFGIYDSDRDYVIGQHHDCPILIKIPEGEVLIESPEGYRIHVNRSVSHLGQFLQIWQDSASVAEARKAMEALAPESTHSGDSCLWGQVLDYESIFDDQEETEESDAASGG